MNRFSRLISCVSLSLLIASGFAATHTTYDLKIKIVPDERVLELSGSAELVPFSAPKKEITLVVADQMTVSEVRLLAPARIAGKVEPEKQGAQNGSTAYTIKFPEEVKKGEVVKIGFKVKGGSKTTMDFNISKEGCFAGGPNTLWYPIFGTLTKAATGVSLDADRAGQGDLEYEVPKDIVVVSIGRKVSRSQKRDRDVWKYHIEQSAALSFAAAKYKVYESPGTPPVAIYTLSDIPEPQNYVDGCRKVVDELSKIFGAYPYPEFAVVEVNDERSQEAGFGGAAMAGYMLSNTSFMEEGFNLAFFSHEIGHQWWGNLVRLSSGDGGYLLDEAMAQYGSLWCVDKLAGPIDSAMYRWRGYPGYIQRQSREGFLHMAAAETDYPLRKMPTSNDSHTLADNKGVFIYHMLAQEIGAEKFHDALHEVTSTYAFKTIPFASFLDIVEKHAGKDMDWFWNQWLDRKGAPMLTLATTISETEVTGTITQSDPPYKLLVPLHLLRGGGGVVVEWVRVEGSQTSFRLPVPGIARVEMDPEAHVLYFSPETKAQADAFTKLGAAVALYGQGKYDEALAACQTFLSTLSEPDRYGVEFYANYIVAGCYRLKKSYPEAREAYMKALACPVKREFYFPYCYLHLGSVAKAMNDMDFAKWCARQALATEAMLGQYSSVSRQAEKFLKGG